MVISSSCLLLTLIIKSVLPISPLKFITPPKFFDFEVIGVTLFLIWMFSL